MLRRSGSAVLELPEYGKRFIGLPLSGSGRKRGASAQVAAMVRLALESDSENFESYC